MKRDRYRKKSYNIEVEMKTGIIPKSRCQLEVFYEYYL